MLSCRECSAYFEETKTDEMYNTYMYPKCWLKKTIGVNVVSCNTFNNNQEVQNEISRILNCEDPLTSSLRLLEITITDNNEEKLKLMNLCCDFILESLIKDAINFQYKTFDKKELKNKKREKKLDEELEEFFVECKNGNVENLYAEASDIFIVYVFLYHEKDLFFKRPISYIEELFKENCIYFDKLYFTWSLRNKLIELNERTYIKEGDVYVKKDA